MELGYFEQDALIEKLARKFYAIQGYVVRDNYRMQSATHPAERACVAMALFAVEEFESIKAESEKELESEEENSDIKWSKGSANHKELEYYFCNYGKISITLLADTESNITRIEVYLNLMNQRQLIYIYDEEFPKQAATIELQNFLSGLAVELQTLSQIEFPGQL